jgi:hypothetical protein
LTTKGHQPLSTINPLLSEISCRGRLLLEIARTNKAMGANGKSLVHSLPQKRRCCLSHKLHMLKTLWGCLADQLLMPNILQYRMANKLKGWSCLAKKLLPYGQCWCCPADELLLNGRCCLASNLLQNGLCCLANNLMLNRRCCLADKLLLNRW